MKKITDSRIAGWIKRVVKGRGNMIETAKRETEFGELRMGIGSSEVIDMLIRLRTALTPEIPKGMAAEDWLKLLSALRDRNLRKSAVAVWTASLAGIVTLPVDQWISAAPSAECIEKTRKASRITRQEMIERLVRDPASIFDTVGAEWLMVHGTPREFQMLLGPILEGKGRPAGLRSPGELISKFLAKDPKCRRLPQVLRMVSEDDGRLSWLVSVARKEVLKGLPLLAQEESTTPMLGNVVRALFASQQTNSQSALRSRCGELAVLGGRLLQVGKLSAEGESLLNEIARIGTDIRLEHAGSSVGAGVWTLEPVESRSAGAGHGFNIEDARQWAIVYERANVDRQPLGYLETLGHNLGLREIVAVGESTCYLPRQHEDVEGGILPGDMVVAITSGWNLNDSTVVRAKVRRPNK